MTTKILAITDLQYTASQDTLEKHLTKLNGIQFVDVQLNSQTIKITYDDTILSIQTILNEIENCGYEASILDTDKTEIIPILSTQKKDVKKISVFLLWIVIGITSLFSYWIPFFFSFLAILFLFPTMQKCLRAHFKLTDESITLFASLILWISSIIYQDSLTLFISISILVLQHILFSLQKETDSSTSNEKETYVNYYDNHKESKKNISQINKKDHIVLRPGESIPADGIVIKGVAYVDESPLSGKKEIVQKNVHSYVYANTKVIKGSITMQVEEIGSTTAMMRLQLTTQKTIQQHSKVSPLSIIDRSLSIYMVIGSLVSFISWFLYSKQFLFSLSIGFGILCASSLHAFSYITEHVVRNYTSLANKKHILFCNPKSLQTTADCDVLYMEQNGVITQDHLTVTDFICKEEYPTSRFEYIVYSLVSRSHRDFSQAITKYLRSKHISTSNIHELRSLSRNGSQVYSSLSKCISGTIEKMIEEGISLKDWETKIDTLRSQGKQIVLFAENKEIIGLVAAQKLILPNTKESIEALQDKGKKVVIFSQDPMQYCQHILKELKDVTIYCQYTEKEKFNLMYQEYINSSTTAYITQEYTHYYDEAVDISIHFNVGTNITNTDCDILLTRQDLNDVLGSIQISKEVNSHIQTLQIGIVIYHCFILIIFSLFLPYLISLPILPLLGKVLSLLSILIIKYASIKE